MPHLAEHGRDVGDAEQGRRRRAKGCRLRSLSQHLREGVEASASIDKRPSGQWRARWREYPGGPQRTKHFARKIDAEQLPREAAARPADRARPLGSVRRRRRGPVRLPAPGVVHGDGRPQHLGQMHGSASRTASWSATRSHGLGSLGRRSGARSRCRSRSQSRSARRCPSGCASPSPSASALDCDRVRRAA